MGYAQPLEGFDKQTWESPKLAKPSKVGINVLQALKGYLPEYQKLIDGLAIPEAELNAKLFSQYLPQYSKAGSDVALQEQKAGVTNDLATMDAGGVDLASRALALERASSPEWASSMQTANKGFQDLIGGMDPNKLSGSEMANVERGVNRLNMRTGNINTGDATTTTANAMQFGGALDAKRNNFANALNLFPGIASQSRSGVNTYDIATGKMAKPNVGTQMFTPQQGSPTAQTAQREFFGASGVQQSGLAQQKSSGEKFGAGMGQLCCFIMAEHYGFGKIPKSVRICRDYFYEKQPASAKGYRKMAYWLVPLMQKSKVVRHLVNLVMIKPLTEYSKYLTGESQWKRIFKPAKLWINFWNFYGNR